MPLSTLAKETVEAQTRIHQPVKKNFIFLEITVNRKRSFPKLHISKAFSEKKLSALLLCLGFTQGTYVSVWKLVKGV